MRIGKTVLLASASVVCLAANGASAQSGNENRAVLDQITVVAKKRATNLQDTSGAITALAGGSLEQMGVADLSDIAIAVPSMSIGEPRLSSTQIISIRGIAGQDGGVAQDEPVGVYLDGVYLGRPQGQFFSLVDIERIEVLKGPQGTLYGRNSTAGAINIITRKPAGDFAGMVEGSIGNFDQYKVRGSLEGGLSDGLSARATFSYTDFGGDLKNTFTGKDERGSREGMARLVFSYDGASDGTTVDLSMDYGWEKTDTVLKNMTIYGNVYDDPDTVDPDLPGRERNRDSGGAGLTIETPLTDSLTLTSVTGYRKLDLDVLYDADATNIARFLQGVDDGYIPGAVAILRDSASYQEVVSSQYSEELRLSYQSDRFNWLAGFFAFHEKAHRQFDVTLLMQSAQIISSQSYGQNKATSFAGFTHGSYRISDMFELEAGLRYSYERKKLHRVIYSGGVTSDESLKDSWNDVTGNITLNVRPTEDVLAYATFAQGFKSGGFNETQRNSLSFDPEKVDSFEIGLKTDLMDGRARVNLSAFRMSYDDLQVRFVSGIGQISIQNAAEATIKGVELDTMAKLTPDLTATFSGSYLDATYDTYVLGANDFSGNRLNQAPEWSIRAALDYRREIAGAGELRAYLSYAWQDDEYYRAENDLINANTGHETLDARLGFSPEDVPGLSVELWGRNLTDDRYVGATVPLANDLIFLGSINRGRSYGLDLRYAF